SPVPPPLCIRRIVAPARCALAPASAPGFPRTGARGESRSSGAPLQPSAARRLRQIAHAPDVRLALSDADHAARLERVEHVAGLDRLLVGGDRQLRLEAALALRRRLAEQVEQRAGVRDLEIVG